MPRHPLFSALLPSLPESGELPRALAGLFVPAPEKKRAETVRNARQGTGSVRRMTLPAEQNLPALVLMLEKDDFSTLRLRVRPDGEVVLRAPRFLTDAEALHFARRKRVWIERRKAEISALPDVFPYRDGAVFLERGERLTLRVTDEGLARTRVERRDGLLLVRGGPADEASDRKSVV